MVLTKILWHDLIKFCRDLNMRLIGKYFKEEFDLYFRNNCKKDGILEISYPRLNDIKILTEIEYSIYGTLYCIEKKNKEKTVVSYFYDGYNSEKYFQGTTYRTEINDLKMIKNLNYETKISSYKNNKYFVEKININNYNKIYYVCEEKYNILFTKKKYAILKDFNDIIMFSHKYINTKKEESRFDFYNYEKELKFIIKISKISFDEIMEINERLWETFRPFIHKNFIICKYYDYYNNRKQKLNSLDANYFNKNNYLELNAEACNKYEIYSCKYFKHLNWFKNKRPIFDDGYCIINKEMIEPYINLISNDITIDFEDFKHTDVECFL